MPKAQYDIYLNQVFALAKTLVIKSMATAFTLNDELKLRGVPVNESDLHTWKYFLNLAGRYHSDDQMMSVVSIDTLQTIDFTVENLQIHKATAKAYQHGSRYYNDIVERYPTQEPLILGILHPVDIDQAINAADGQILYYDRQLVESNETNLIPGLQKWIDGVYARWNVADYQVTDELYVGSFIAMLYNFIPATLLNLRNANCHTRFAHSFHIKEFLTSHGRLDPYLDYLTKQQMLWLYRNIRYLHRNAGQQETLEWLIENLLTLRKIPLAQWEMRHDLSQMPEQLYPKVEFVRFPMNLGYHLTGSDTKSITQMLDDEQSIAAGNIRVQSQVEPEIETVMENAMSNRLTTKVLESAMVDLVDALPFTYSAFILHHWLYLSHIGRYNSIVNFEDPRTGEPSNLTTLDAFIVFLYAYNKKDGVTILEVPTIEADLVRKIPRPTREHLRSLADPAHLPDAVLDALNDAIVPILTSISIEGFRDNMKACHAGLMQQWFIWSQQSHYKTRGVAELIGLHFYCDYPCALAPGVRYEDWFAQRNLPYGQYNTFECEMLANSLLKEATGVNLADSQSAKEIQAALLRLMAKLSSYTVQYLQKINSESIKIVDWPQLRLGDLLSLTDVHEHINALDVDVQSMSARPARLEQLDVNKLGAEVKVKESDEGLAFFPIDLFMRSVHGVEKRYQLLIPKVTVRSYDKTVYDLEADTPIRVTDEYQSINYLELSEAFTSLSTNQYVLTPEHHITLSVRWLEYVNDPTRGIPLEENLTVWTLNGIYFNPLISFNTSLLAGFELD